MRSHKVYSRSTLPTLQPGQQQQPRHHHQRHSTTSSSRRKTPPSPELRRASSQRLSAAAAAGTLGGAARRRSSPSRVPLRPGLRRASSQHLSVAAAAGTLGGAARPRSPSRVPLRLRRRRPLPPPLEPLKAGHRIDPQERVFLEAAEHGDKHTVQRCLQGPQPVNVNCTNILGRSAIQVTL